jgi:two-component system, LuxR family, response regulator FixJ
MSPDATVFVVDDDPAVRHSLAWLIESVELRVETFPSAQAFLEAYDAGRPGCLVLDVRMPGMSGTDLQERLVAMSVMLPVIFVTGHGDVPMAVRAMKRGALDFIEKPFNNQELLDRIHQAIQQDASQRREHARLADLCARMASLTPREREVMDMVVAGKTNKEMARDLNVSVKTIEAHRARVTEKVRARSVSELVQMALACSRYRENPESSR